MKPANNAPDTTQLDFWAANSSPPPADTSAVTVEKPATTEATDEGKSPPKKSRCRKKRRTAKSADEASRGRLDARSCPGRPDRLDIEVDFRTGQQLRALAHRLGITKRAVVRRLLRVGLELYGPELLAGADEKK